MANYRRTEKQLDSERVKRMMGKSLDEIPNSDIINGNYMEYISSRIWNHTAARGAAHGFLSGLLYGLLQTLCAPVTEYRYNRRRMQAMQTSRVSLRLVS